MALTTNIVSYWKFDSSNSNDSVGSNNGTDTSITYSAGNGKINNGAGLSGSSKIDFGTPSNLAFEYTTAFTINCWVKPTSTTTTGILFSKELVGSGYTGYALYLAAGVPTFLAVNNNASNQTSVNGTTNLTGGTWYMVTITWAGVGAGTGSKIYVNGTDNTSGISPATLSASILNAATVQIGNRGAGDLPYTGAIDEVGVWSRALSSTEITQLYNGGSGFQYPFASDTNALSMGVAF